MNRSLLHRGGSTATNLVLLASLYICELSAVLFVVAIYRLVDKPIHSFLSGRPGFFSIVALPIFVISSGVIVHQHRKSRGCGSRQFSLTVMMNLITVIILLAIGEVAIRLFAFRTPAGLVFLNTLLLPRSWSNEVARNRETLRKAAANGSYLVYDDLMGWTVGPNRRSADGLNFSSVEGIRSPRSDMAFANLPTRHRIALVGDSFTFGLEVKYEETWGYQLERHLGPGYQVLNFGVDGYGVDQAYLRYYRDVRPWHPDVVIFGLINHDLYRTMVVYSFVSFPEWEFPFAKPRFVVTDEQLAILNVPPLTPEAICSKNSIEDLPFIECDRGYNQTDWQWYFYHHFHLFRFFISRYPIWQTPRREVSGEAMKLVNSEILRSFVRLATAEGSIPIVVYFPARSSLRASSSSTATDISLAFSVLQCAHIEYIDLTPCVLKVNAADRFVIGRPHYSPLANAAVAKCLREVILKHLSGIKSHDGDHQISKRDDEAKKQESDLQSKI